METENEKNDKLRELNVLSQNQKVQENHENHEPGLLDGWEVLPTEDIPENGLLYPQAWKFLVKAPISNDVAIFSTLDDRDKIGVFNACESLIRKYVMIWDTEKNRQISTGEINDHHRISFVLILRKLYLQTNITYERTCSCGKERKVELTNRKLQFREIKQKMLAHFNGRIFDLTYEDGVRITFHIPTLNMSSMIYNYILRNHRIAKDDNKNKKHDPIINDKNFLLFASYMFKTGNETMQEIISNYKDLSQDSAKLKVWLKFITLLALGNEDYIEDTCECGLTEETPLKFPGGWKMFFIDDSTDKDTEGFF